MSLLQRVERAQQSLAQREEAAAQQAALDLAKAGAPASRSPPPRLHLPRWCP
jgi:hypothetical protein